MSSENDLTLRLYSEIFRFVMKLKRAIKPKRKLFNFKATESEMKLIQKKADKYADGNMSEWVRYASTSLEPKPTDMIDRAADGTNY